MGVRPGGVDEAKDPGHRLRVTRSSARIAGGTPWALVNRWLKESTLNHRVDESIDIVRHARVVDCFFVCQRRHSLVTRTPFIEESPKTKTG